MREAGIRVCDPPLKQLAAVNQTQLLYILFQRVRRIKMRNGSVLWRTQVDLKTSLSISGYDSYRIGSIACVNMLLLLNLMSFDIFWPARMRRFAICQELTVCKVSYHVCIHFHAVLCILNFLFGILRHWFNICMNRSLTYVCFECIGLIVRLVHSCMSCRFKLYSVNLMRINI